MSNTSYSNAKILMVDDQEPNLRLLERILKQGEYNCFRSLKDSRQAASVFREFQPDLVLLDLMMPHLDGVAVLQALCPLMAGARVPVLMLTADVAAESKRRALAAGATDFLTKPLDAVEVLLRIKNLLEMRFLYQEVQRRADSRIQEQAALLDRANDAILVRDMGNRILYWNEGAERLYGWTASEIVGQDAGTIQTNGGSGVLALAGQAVLTEGKWHGELQQATKDGQEITVASRWTLVCDEHGQPKSQLVINTDITEKKKLEAQLIEAQRLEAIGLLAGGVAHDFNNLLTIIIGCSEVALGTVRREEPAHELIAEVRKAGKRAAALTRQLLAFSRKQVLAPVVLDLNALISETEKMVRRLIGADVNLSTVLDPALGPVKADPGQIEQVLMNLVLNACDAMPTGGEVTIETRNVDVDESYARKVAELQPGPWVLLAVSDTGCGMDESTQARVFEPFFTTKGVGKGTGLGLATVYGIVKQTGGCIQVHSALDRGTKFTIYLPRLDQQEAADGTCSGVRVFPRGTGTVLLVEDEEAVRSLGAMGLRSAGYTVLEAKDGEEALTVCQAHAGPIDLLATDVVMPKLSGRQLADRATSIRPNLKVLYVSGYTDDTIVRHGVWEAGIAFLPKPFSPAVLARKVHEVLGH